MAVSSLVDNTTSYSHSGAGTIYKPRSQVWHGCRATMTVVLFVIVAVFANKRVVKLNEKHAVNHRCTYCNLLPFYAGPYERVRFGRQ